MEERETIVTPTKAVPEASTLLAADSISELFGCIYMKFHSDPVLYTR